MASIAQQLECEIYIHSSKHKHDVMRNLNLALGEEGDIYDVVKPEFKLNLQVLETDISGPSDYFENHILNKFFEYVIHYRPQIKLDCNLSFDELQKVHAAHVTEILQYFWANKIPAATSCSYDDLLPMRGGNDETQIFWKDTTKYIVGENGEHIKVE
jgi:hypothetical protein